MKDAGEIGARTAPPDARAGPAVSVTGSADFLDHKALLCVTQSGRRSASRTGQQAGDGGDPGTGGGPARAGAGAGARVNIMALVAEK